MVSKKSTSDTEELPDYLADLPRFGFTPARPSTREQSMRRDVVYGVRTLDDLAEVASKRFLALKKPAESDTQE